MMRKTSATPHEYGQTTLMEDGQTALFPELYTEWFGVKKKGSGPMTKQDTDSASQTLRDE